MSKLQTVGDLVTELLKLDQTLPVFGEKLEIWYGDWCYVESPIKGIDIKDHFVEWPQDDPRRKDGRRKQFGDNHKDGKVVIVAEK